MFQYENKILRPAIIKKLTKASWNVEITHGGLYQSGWPDLYCMHRTWGVFWLELKKSREAKLRASQVLMFTKWSRFNVPVWIAYQVSDVPFIFREPANWWKWIKI